ncbi:MAG: hypothetical protein ACFHXK_08080 [bacterium]
MIASAVGLMTGTIPPSRIAVGLPCGEGKTTAIRAVVWAMHKLGRQHTVLIACTKVEQLCGLLLQMTRPDTAEADGDGIPTEMLGLMHSYQYDEEHALQVIHQHELLKPNHATAPSEGHDRQVLLVAHERIKGSDKERSQGEHRETHSWLQRDICFYDESLIVSEARVFPILSETQEGLLGEISKLRNLAKYKDPQRYGQAADWMDKVEERLMPALQSADTSPVVITLPSLTTEVQDHLLNLLNRKHWPRIHDLVHFSNEDVRVHRTDEGDAMITYRISVPSALDKVLITDASDPIRELVRADQTIQRVEDVMPRLEKFRQNGLSQIKRFDEVNIFHLRVSGGRSKMHDAFNKKSSNWVTREVIKVIEAASPEEEFIVFTYLPGDGVDYPRQINLSIDEHGISRFKPGTDDLRIHVLTWGMETALNNWSKVPNVILAGVLLKPKGALAGESMGAKRDLRDPEIADTSYLKELQYSEAAHFAYQAANRGAIRNSKIDNQGQAQAHPGNVWVIHYDAGLKGRMDKVMPGANWLPWEVEGNRGNTYSDAMRIVERLKELYSQGVYKVSCQWLKQDLGIDNRDHWKAARRMAEEMCGWTVAGRSLEAIFPE